MTPKNHSVRLSAGEREYLALHGENIGDGVHKAIGRLRRLIGVTPPVTEEEALAICGCLNGSWVMMDMGSGGSLYLHHELEDYPRCAGAEAGQFAVDYEALALKATGWSLAEQFAVLHAVEAVFADRSGEDPRDLVRKYFRTV